jgi:serine/threonine protein kinase
MIGETVGSYRVTQKVAVGGMGTVYRAEHSLIGKPAAVKVLHPELRGNQEVVQRFFNEAKATTQIKHPGIVEIFDFGYLPTGDGYIVMEFLEGESLARRLETSGKMDEGEAAVLMRSVCNALAAAHGKNIIHRDLKPDNIFLCPDPDAPTGERPKLLDFGIAKLNIGLTGPQNATKTGAVMGTPTYMSPEQCKGTGEVDARSDLYSIGCMFYEMVAGRPPFDNMATGELIGAHLFIEPVSPRTAGAMISGACESLIMQLLAKQPAKRVQTAQELGRRFAELAQGQGFTTHATPVPTANHKVTQRDVANEGVLPTMQSDPSLQQIAKPTPSPRVPTPSPPADSKPNVTMTPTTLSGAASQMHKTVGRSRAPLFAGLAAAFLVAGGATFFAISNGTKSNDVAPASAPTSAPADPASGFRPPVQTACACSCSCRDCTGASDAHATDRDEAGRQASQRQVDETRRQAEDHVAREAEDHEACRQAEDDEACGQAEGRRRLGLVGHPDRDRHLIRL